MDYQLNSLHQQRLLEALEAAWAVPFIDNIEDFIWEAVFAYAKNVPLVDPLYNTRSKRLFDLVDPISQVGWSAKAIQVPRVTLGMQYELVIQRADIFKKARELGFDWLSTASATRDLGAALLRHWSKKVDSDAQVQGVRHKRMCVLLKAKNHRTYAVHESDIHQYSPEMIEWRWTNESETGLQGIRIADGFCVYRWYPNQKHLFERFSLPVNTPVYSLTPRRLTLDSAVERIRTTLHSIS